MQIRKLRTHAEVVTAVGGKAAFADLISAPGKPRTVNHVGNYLRDCFFPADCFDVVTFALGKLGYEASAALFGQVPRKAVQLSRKAS